MSEENYVSPARILRDLVPGEAWEGLTCFPRKRHSAGATLLRQGDSGTHVLALIRGMVKVVRGESGGRDRLLAFRGPGEVLGEMAVQDGGGRLAHVRAISECEVSVVPAEEFRDFVKRHNLASQLAEYAVSRVREQTQACEGDIGRRLALALLRLVEISGARSFSITREELAQHLGVGRNSVSGVLKRFGTERVRAERTRIEVADEVYLRCVVRGRATE
ncbi:Crp/Fnr family transcriptional regulator [Streptomyces sp. NPDC020379]|uniref:Crp/Fnr family transcriptional regulator n=1 Tax=Streptomyces sp. NPDC020379 TaxID=3365071 RepID=UPI003792771F